MKILKIMKIIEFHLRMMTNHENPRNQSENYENHENLKIPMENNENPEDLRIPRKNHEIHKHLEIIRQNQEKKSCNFISES